MVPATILGVCIHFFPYSPRWLVMVDRHEDSLRALARLRRRPTEDEKVQLEWRSIIGEIAFQREVAQKEHPGASGFQLEVSRWLDLFKKNTWRRTAAAVGICFFTQFSGIVRRQAGDDRRIIANRPRTLLSTMHQHCSRASANLRT
jgi:hypothetical protein